jgi:hypothetical protein
MFRYVSSLFLSLLLAPSIFGEDVYAKRDTWPESMLATRFNARQDSSQGVTRQKDVLSLWLEMARDYPMQSDWMVQDAGSVDAALNFFRSRAKDDLEEMIARAVETSGVSEAVALRKRTTTLQDRETRKNWRQWLDAYERACKARRTQRLAPLQRRWETLVFTKHYNFGGSHYAYTEGQSDAQRERTFVPGSALCLLDLASEKVTTLIDSPQGVIRDPDVSYDGKRILFSWKKSDREDDFHLYEYDTDTTDLRQLTHGLGFADYEGVYLPDGNILFNSTRCVQTVDCWWTEVSNLYTCDGDGRFLRRVSFDQVHTNYPTVSEDGRVLYTRWDYNDRGQLFPQPLFQMNLDGTGQTEFYGNNSWFPTTIMHARDIPGSPRTVAILSGHHSHQRGQLAVIDPRLGRQENLGVQLIAPVRETPAERIDAYGQRGVQFQYPYPLDEENFVVTLCPYESDRTSYVFPFGLYWVNAAGARELLAFDASISCSQPVPLASRPTPHVRPSVVDYAKKEGTYYVQDVYYGPGLEGVARGSVKALRVIALEFRAAGVGDNRSQGEAGGALVSTPIAAGNGSWDVKRVLGDAKVYADGSAFFTVPAQTPVYFQAIDDKGLAAQTMRSWSTLQPGEAFSCVGCHEKKGEAPTESPSTQALAAGPQPLQEFHGPARGFSFQKEVQPILDEHCISCHDGDEAFGLRGTPVEDRFAKRYWSESYLALTKSEPGMENNEPRDYRAVPNERVSFITNQSVPTMLPPYHVGAVKSGLMKMLEKGHHDVALPTPAWEILASWIDLNIPFCGDYREANAWSAEDKAFYDKFEDKRNRMAAEEQRNIAALRETLRK